MNVAQLRRYALSLPEVTEEPHFDYASFRVCGRIFVTIAPDAQFAQIFVGEEEREAALALHADFVEKLVWGSKVRGLRVCLARAASSVVNGLVRTAWKRKAPKALVARPGIG
jgi:hypothetical protein